MKSKAHIIRGDCRQVLAGMPADSVHCVVTSPPYWNLRDYGTGAQGLGLEPTFDQHLDALVDTFEAVRRVLRPDGVLWLNYGDAYDAGTHAARQPSRRVDVGAWNARADKYADRLGRPDPRGRTGRFRGDDTKPKDLLMMPAQVALALRAAGWWLRSQVVWEKTNPKPDSGRDRPATSYDLVYLLTPSARYFYDGDAVRTPYAESTRREFAAGSYDGQDLKDYGAADGVERPGDLKNRISAAGDQGGANLRNVWRLPTDRFTEAHFATFPPDLVRLCILSGTSARGVCPACGAPWERVRAPDRGGTIGRGGWHDHTQDAERGAYLPPEANGTYERGATLRWEAACDCPAADHPVPAVVLDPFAGSGTVGLVAEQLGRRALLVELSGDYCRMAPAANAGRSLADRTDGREDPAAFRLDFAT